MKRLRESSASRRNPWKTLSSRVVSSNPWFRLRRDRVIRPDGKRGVYNTILSPLAVGIVPCFEDGSILIVGKYRYSISRYSWEIPEGGARPGERPIQTARREMEEETGLRASTMKSLGIFHTSNSFTEEKAYLFCASGLKSGNPHRDGTEEIVTRRIPFDAAHQMAVDGMITDSLTIVALFRMKERGVLPWNRKRWSADAGPSRLAFVPHF